MKKEQSSLEKGIEKFNSYWNSVSSIDDTDLVLKNAIKDALADQKRKIKEWLKNVYGFEEGSEALKEFEELKNNEIK